MVIFKLTLVNGGWGISYEIALRWMPLDLADDKSTLVQVMAWCRQAKSHPKLIKMHPPLKQSMMIQTNLNFVHVQNFNLTELLKSQLELSELKKKE